MTIPVPGRILPLSAGTFRALQHRDFRLLWIGQLVSLSGSWMQSVAQGWLVLRLSDSAFLLGIVGFCSYTPVLALSLVGGVAADRLPRRVALLWTQAAAMGLAALLATLTGLGVVRVWHVAAMAIGLGIVTAFDIPIRQAFLQDLVGGRDLPNAIALNSLAFNSARLVGPAVAGIVLAAWGETICFALNAVSFLAVLCGLLLMRSRPPPPPPSGSWTGGIRRVLSYAWRTPRLRLVLLLVAVSSVFGMPYSILMPAFARDALGAGSREFGFLVGASGVGSIVGALYLAGRRGTARAGRVVAAAMAIFGLAIVGFAFSRTHAVALAFLVVVGAAMIVQMATSNTYLQMTAPPDLRGRVVSLYTLCFVGMAPFGSLLSGILARQLGVRAAVASGGAMCVIVAAAFSVRLAALGAPDVNPSERVPVEPPDGDRPARR